MSGSTERRATVDPDNWLARPGEWRAGATVYLVQDSPRPHALHDARVTFDGVWLHVEHAEGDGHAVPKGHRCIEIFPAPNVMSVVFSIPLGPDAIH